MTAQSHPSGMTVKQRVLVILNDDGWHSQQEFLSNFIPTAAQRISELNADYDSASHPFVIVSEKAKDSPCHRYKIVPREKAEKIKSGGGYSYRLIS